MTRTEFNTAYRAARVALKTFAANSWETGRYGNLTVEAKRVAEARWIAGVRNPKTFPAYKALGDSMHMHGTTSTAAIHDFRFCGGGRKQWYLDTARDNRV